METRNTNSRIARLLDIGEIPTKTSDLVNDSKFVTNNTDNENSLALGDGSSVTADSAIQLGNGTNDEENTFKVALNGNNITVLNSEGQIPYSAMTSVKTRLDSLETSIGTINTTLDYINGD